VTPSSDENRPAETPSFDALYERYGSRVLNVIYRMTGNQEVAHDLAQDVWMRVYQNLDRFEARADVFTWIYRIAVNRSLNHLKQEKRRRWIDLLDRTVGEVLTEDNVDQTVMVRPPARRPDRTVEDEQLARHLWNARFSRIRSTRTWALWM